MSELFDQPSEGENAPEFSVSEISGVVKRMIEGEFSHVRIRGEVGRVSMPRSGHVYMDLKDDRAVLAGVIWKGVASRLTTRPEEGMEVVATGRLTTFPGQSKYQMVIEDIKPAGMGALMAMLEKRKAALAAEGLFAPERKQPLPYLPEVIGVVTSPSGAVIRDILHRLRDRFPRKVLIWPVAVQGQKCAPEVANAIRGFNAMTPGGSLPRPDLLIVARGGGSIEDLWGFNEEEVARAAAASQIPLISAVGHETDTTLVDYASDMRAPTPTAAAELAVPVRLELLGWLDQQNARLSRALTQAILQRGQRLRDIGRALPRADRLLDGPRQNLDRWGGRLPQGLTQSVQLRRVTLSKVSGGLRTANLRRQITEQKRRLSDRAPQLDRSLNRAIVTKKEALQNRLAGLKIAPLQADCKRKQQDLAGLSDRFAKAAQRQAQAWRSDIDRLDRLRETLGYRETLKRGYAVVHSDKGLVTTAKSAKQATSLEIEFADGKFALSPASKTIRKPSSKKPPSSDQGSLF